MTPISRDESGLRVASTFATRTRDPRFSNSRATARHTGSRARQWEHQGCAPQKCVRSGAFAARGALTYRIKFNSPLAPTRLIRKIAVVEAKDLPRGECQDAKPNKHARHRKLADWRRDFFFFPKNISRLVRSFSATPHCERAGGWRLSARGGGRPLGACPPSISVPPILWGP